MRKGARHRKGARLRKEPPTLAPAASGSEMSAKGKEKHGPQGPHGSLEQELEISAEGDSIDERLDPKSMFSYATDPK